MTLRRDLWYDDSSGFKLYYNDMYFNGYYHGRALPSEYSTYAERDPMVAIDSITSTLHRSS